MRLKELLERVDSLRPNRFTPFQKERWTDALQRRIYSQLLAGREGFDGYEIEKDNIDGRRELEVVTVEEGNRIAVSDGPYRVPYDIIGQRIFAGSDYYTVTQTDFEFDSINEMWGIRVNGPVPSDIEKVYPAATVFPKGSDELIISGEYEGLYIYWLLSKIDFFNRETVSYNNSSAMFNALYDEYEKSLIRNKPYLTDTKVGRDI